MIDFHEILHEPFAIVDHLDAIFLNSLSTTVKKKKKADFRTCEAIYLSVLKWCM